MTSPDFIIVITTTIAIFIMHIVLKERRPVPRFKQFHTDSKIIVNHTSPSLPLIQLCDNSDQSDHSQGRTGLANKILVPYMNKYQEAQFSTCNYTGQDKIRRNYCQNVKKLPTSPVRKIRVSKLQHVRGHSSSEEWQDSSGSHM